MVSQDSKASGQAQDPAMSPVDFSTLILGLSSAALYYLGETSLEGRPAQKNVPLAKHNIDIMMMLREKTRGNLTPDEAKLVEQLVSDLQLKLLEAAR